MLVAHQRDRWNHTSHLLALIANCNRDPKTRRQPFEPAEFNPYAERPKRQRIKAPITALRTVFIDRR